MFFILLFAILSLSSETAEADIYRYTSDDGVECYTDAPVTRKAVLMLRERRVSSGRSKKTDVTAKASSPVSSGPSKRSPSSPRPAGLPVSGIISSSVGLRYDPIDGMLRNHNGIDIAVPEGTPVRPVASGTVTYSGRRNGYGNMMIIGHDDGMVTIYAHNRVNLARTGDRVDNAETIALSGSTGRSTGPHLHFEAWQDGENITSEFLDGVPVAGSGSLVRAAARKRNRIRKVVMDDGTIMLTNLPLRHP